jgi:hypothetical protein
MVECCKSFHLGIRKDGVAGESRAAEVGATAEGRAVEQGVAAEGWAAAEGRGDKRDGPEKYEND